ncbi:unnamed protein product [Vitrella brassicaformis CCMP3155]|uniref:Uncharacterized protein n=1 Tax=Vitrella brassicaformis (strain CCMP3155) TaxID=1169540 RepID=A0A0G4FTI2_VITBC|nr:unnamed protein product [Vitrella brassicaformis CCMP3155]|eukprot:CEM18070.1 unnamed protein product [Vitrella brassicaformis CCMP3155]
MLCYIASFAFLGLATVALSVQSKVGPIPVHDRFQNLYKTLTGSTFTSSVFGCDFDNLGMLTTGNECQDARAGCCPTFTQLKAALNAKPCNYSDLLQNASKVAMLANNADLQTACTNGCLKNAKTALES